jgi:chlorobactene glucosyltransferase
VDEWKVESEADVALYFPLSTFCFSLLPLHFLFSRIPMLYLILSTAFFIGGIGIIYWLHNQYHLDIAVEPTAPPDKAPLISFCVPARNEERNIRACVEGLLAQDYPNFEIIVLDDRSTDATPAILRQLALESGSSLPNLQEPAPALHVIHGSDLPAGWAGKPHALYQASAAARGEWLCFVDADTFLSPATLSSCYAKAIETKADMFTIMTFQILGSFWEKAVMPLVMTALSVGFSPRKVNDPARKDAIANGQFILIKRSVYDAIGGHERVKDNIVEDKAIAEQVKWNGYRLIVADGYLVARTRMYTSLPEMWEGWTKNIYLGLRDRSGLLWLGVFGAIIALLAALFVPIWPFLGINWYFGGGGGMAAAVLVESLIFWAYMVFARVRVARKMEISPWYAFSTPLGSAIFAAMMITSAFRVLAGKGVTWKGRSYASR